MFSCKDCKVYKGFLTLYKKNFFRIGWKSLTVLTVLTEKYPKTANKPII